MFKYKTLPETNYVKIKRLFKSYFKLMSFTTLMPTFLASSSSLILLLEELSSIITVSCESVILLLEELSSIITVSCESVESIDEDRDTFNCTGEACGEADSKSS